VNKIVNYEWEQRYSNGNLIAVHKSGEYFAYTIRLDNNGKVRVFHRKLNEKILLKSFKGRVIDLSFAYHDVDVLLGCVDEVGCAQVFRITLDANSKMQANTLLNLASYSMSKSISGSSTPASESGNFSNLAVSGLSTAATKSNSSSLPSPGAYDTFRFMWCMYIPEPNGESTLEQTEATQTDDASKVFVLTRKNRADIFNIELIENNYDCSCPLDADELMIGHLLIDEHKSNILTASFSPDGSAIATASADGEVNFFNITFARISETESGSNPEFNGEENYEANTHLASEQEQSLDGSENQLKNKLALSKRERNKINIRPKCLQKWRPHDNKPVNSLYFLDDHMNPSPEAQFWSFILTGADFNREIKLWCCLKWECLQTIRFVLSPLSGDEKSFSSSGLSQQQHHGLLPYFKTGIDLSSHYLVMSDITSKCFYILTLNQNHAANTARCTCISEFMLAYPALSFAIIDSQIIKAKKFRQIQNLNAVTVASQSGIIDIMDELDNKNDSLSQELVTGSNISLVPQLSNAESDENLIRMIRLYCIQIKQLQEMQIFLNGIEDNMNTFENSASSPPLGQALFNNSISLPHQQTQPHRNESASALGGSLSQGSSTSILNQLLPNSLTANMAAKSGSINGVNTRLSSSMSFSSDVKDHLSDVITSDLEQDANIKSKLNGVKYANVNNTNVKSNSLKPLSLNSTNISHQQQQQAEDDSAIVKIVSPPSIGGLGAPPLLMTPDAFINSPNNVTNNSSGKRSSVEQHKDHSNSTSGGQQQKNDLLKSFVNASISSATNLASSQSSLTQVTSMNVSSLPTSIQQQHQQQQQPILSNNRNRSQISSARSSSSSTTTTTSSSDSSTTSSSSSSSTSSDEADKEIAALSSSVKMNNMNMTGMNNSTSGLAKKKPQPKRSSNLDESTLSNKSNKSLPIIKKQDSLHNKSNVAELVYFKGDIDKVKLEETNTEESQDNLQQPFVLASKSFDMKLNQNWLNSPNKLSSTSGAASADSVHLPSSTSSLLTTIAPIYITGNEMNKNDEAGAVGAIDLKSLLLQMTHALRSQHEEIENLKKHQMHSQQQLKSQIDKTLNQFLNNQQQQQATATPSNSNILESDSTIQQAFDNQMQNKLADKLDKLVKDELNKCIQAQFAARLFEPLRDQLSRELAEKMKAIESVLKDSVAKLFKSKSTLDSLSQSVAGSMQGLVINSYRDTFQKVIVPNFEKSCQNMYQQVNNTFGKGTNDYLQEFDQLAKQHRKLYEEHKEPLIMQLKQYTESMRLHGIQVANEMATNLQQQFDGHLRNATAVLQDTIISSVKAIIKEELQLAMRDQQQSLPDRLLNCMRQSGALTPLNTPSNASGFVLQQQHSSAPTPTPQVSTIQDTQMQITNHLQKGQLNSAFQVALCAADLNLLINLCELVSPTKVFEQTVDPLNSKSSKPQCQLQQPVILSLIQQLSQDFSANVELKLKYIEEAVMNLDLNNLLTREHTPGVIGQLIVKLQQFIQANPNDKINKQLRMLIMASQSLLSTPKPQIKTQQLL
jgi:hypothetical protein